MDVEKYIETLKREQEQLALASLINPRARDAFEFGLIVGQVQAYERMLSHLNEQLAAAEGKPKAEQRPSKMANPYLEELDAAPFLPEQMSKRR